jgi:hypothetical protein
MKFKYVGKKERETAFSEATGIVWEPGSEHDIADKAVAKRMLAHPDVFEPVALADAAPAAEGDGLSAVATTTATKPADAPPQEPQAPAEADKPAALVMMTKAGPLDLSTLDKAQLHQLAKDEGVDIHPNAKAETVAKRLAEMFPVPAAHAAEGAE